MKSNYKETFTIGKHDSESATYELSDNKSNYVCLLLEKINGNWNLLCFMRGKAGNSYYRQSWINKEVYEKCGRGRESKASKELIQELYDIALTNIYK